MHHKTKIYSFVLNFKFKEIFFHFSHIRFDDDFTDFIHAFFSPDLISYKVAEKINENTPNSILMMVSFMIVHFLSI